LRWVCWCWCWDLLGRRTNGDKYRLLFGAEQGIGLGFGQSESEVRRCRILWSYSKLSTLQLCSFRPIKHETAVILFGLGGGRSKLYLQYADEVSCMVSLTQEKTRG
jgi:hypothetical protein